MATRSYAIAALTLAQAASVAAQDRCISSTLRDTQMRCEAAPRIDGERTAPRLLGSRADRPRSEHAPTPGYEPRPADPTRPRAEALLRRELRILERLAERTDADDTRRPEILLRLAESYYELADVLRTQLRALDEPVHQACRVARDRPRCRERRAAQERLEGQHRHTLEEAARTYATLTRDHPEHPRDDETLFALAMTLDGLAAPDRARRVYHQLIRRHPTSRFVPQAYLSFGEHYFAEGDLDSALRFYERVLQTPPARNPVYGYALYKQAWAHYNAERYRESLEAFVRTVELAQRHPELADVENLARQSRRELVMPYAHVGRPSQALAFFRRYARDDDTALEMLESLAVLYQDTGRWAEAIATHHALLAERPRTAAACRWQGRVVAAVVASRPKDEQLRELRRWLDLRDSLRRDVDVGACSAEAASQALQLAIAWHREAVGTDAQPGTRDERTMSSAEALYDLVLRAFPDLDGMDLPGIVGDAPTRAAVAYYRGDLAFVRQDWRACAEGFERAYVLEPRGPLAGDAALGTAQCWEALLRTRGGQSERVDAERERRSLDEQEARMAIAFRRYLCALPDGDDAAFVRYRLARLHYEAAQWSEAALHFREVWRAHPDSELAGYAANLHLASLEAEAASTPACFDAMSSAASSIATGFCGDADAAPELCEVVTTVRCNLLRRDVEELARAERWSDAGTRAVHLVRDHPECTGMARDEVLYNAGIYFEKARRLGRAIQVRGVLVSQHPESELARRAVAQIGGNHHALALYTRAAEHYERYAESVAEHGEARCTEARCATGPELLRHAVFFRLGTGDDEAAARDAALFARAFGRRDPGLAATVAFAAGTPAERAGDWRAVEWVYARFLRTHRRHATVPQRMRAHVLLGRAAEAQDASGARHYERALAVWSNRGDLALPDLRDALESAAEARFLLAEDRYRAFAALRFPTYRGGRSFESIERWVGRSFEPWILEKLAALRAAESAYAEVAEIRGEVDGVTLRSPSWQIAAARRSGHMYDEIVDLLETAPIPREIEDDRDLVDEYLRVFAAHAREIRTEAVARYEFCVRTSTNVRWFDEHSRACESALHRLEPARYPLASELRGRPAHEHGDPGPPGPLVLGRDT